MPSLNFLAGVVGLFLQYSLLVLIYYFLFRIVKAIYLDLRNTNCVNGNQLAVRDSRKCGQHPARLVVVERGRVSLPQKFYPLTDSVSIGRGMHNDICIDDNFVSHEHACISLYKGDYWLADLHSTNGTWLNGDRVKDEVRLRPNDIIKIGEVVFRFER